MSKKNYIKVNFPSTVEDFEQGYGEGMFVIVDDDVYRLYKEDAKGMECVGTLDSDSLTFGELIHGTEVRFKMMGRYKPVAIPTYICRDGHYVEWDGKLYPIREVTPPKSINDGYPVRVADIVLWWTIEEAYHKGDKGAIDIDSGIFFYCDYGFIASEPTDEEIVEYLIKSGC